MFYNKNCQIFMTGYLILVYMYFNIFIIHACFILNKKKNYYMIGFFNKEQLYLIHTVLYEIIIIRL